MNTRPRLLVAGIASLTLLGIAGARIQARLSAHSSPEATQSAEEAEALSTRYASLGDQVFARRFEMRDRRLELDLADADVILRSVRAPLDVASGDGDIRINLLDANETTVTTGDGDVVLTAPADIAADVYLEGEDLSVAHGLELIGRIRRHSVRGTLNGGGPTIEVRTGDGSISLRRGN